MKALVLYEYPPQPAGLATQGDLLRRGLLEAGVDARGVHYESPLEQEWYYRWFQPDVVVGVGYWGLTPQLVLHPLAHGKLAVPWLVADGYVANYQDVLNRLPLILATSRWVKEAYARDGIREEIVEVLPVGCDTDAFVPRDPHDPRVAAVREALGVGRNQLLILTIGGDAASKGGHEVMQALAAIRDQAPDWKYVCKVWPQPRTEAQNREDRELAQRLGIAERVTHVVGRNSREFMPWLMAACDIYAAPSRLEGFGMPQVEAGACGKPVVSINAMAMLDTLVHGRTAFLARVAGEEQISEGVAGADAGYDPPRRITFPAPRTVSFRADVDDLGRYLKTLMNDAGLRSAMGAAGREHVTARFDYRQVARRLMEILSERLEVT